MTAHIDTYNSLRCSNSINSNDCKFDLHLRECSVCHVALQGQCKYCLSWIRLKKLKQHQNSEYCKKYQQKTAILTEKDAKSEGKSETYTIHTTIESLLEATINHKQHQLVIGLGMHLFQPIPFVRTSLNELRNSTSRGIRMKKILDTLGQVLKISSILYHEILHIMDIQDIYTERIKKREDKITKIAEQKIMKEYKEEMDKHVILTTLGTNVSGASGEQKRKLRQYELEERPKKKLKPKQKRYKKAKKNNCLKKLINEQIEDFGGFEEVVEKGLLSNIAQRIVELCATNIEIKRFERTFAATSGGKYMIIIINQLGNAILEIYAHHNAIDLGDLCKRIRVETRKIGEYKLSVPKEKCYRDVKLF